MNGSSYNRRLEHAGTGTCRNCAVDVYRTDLQSFSSNVSDKKILFKPVNEMLQKRRSMADAEIQDATKAKEEALAMKTEYEQNMQQAKAKASDIVTEAQRTASLQSEEILKSAAQEARAMKEKAESDIAQEKRKAVNEVKNEIGGMAMEIAGKVIEREIKEEDHAKLIDEFISNVGEAS